MLTKRDYEMAMLSQGACNGRALIKSLAEIAGRMEERGDEFNGHPLIRLFVEQLHFLSTGNISYHGAYDACELRAKVMPEETQC
jgi:hypothetical protein